MRPHAEAPAAAIPALAATPDQEHGKPSIAVVPFQNLSQDSEHEYFAYGLTEDVVRLLGRNRWLTVMTRHTTAPGRGSEVDARALGAALGVRYLVEGSVRRHGERVRITAGLVAADTGTQLWSEVYDLHLADIFDIQDAMAKQIAAVIEPELASHEQEIAHRKAPESLDAWDCYQRGFYHLWGFTTPGFAEAEALFRRAIELEPGLARAHAAMSYVHLQNAFYGDPKERPALIEAAMASARTSVALDERDSLCHCVLGRAYCLQRHYDDAIAALEETVALNPSFAQGYFALAFTLVWCGRQDEAIALIETAAELSPRDPHIWTFHHTRAFAHFALDEMKSAAFFARKASRHQNATYWTFATLAAALGRLGVAEEAEEAVAELLSRKPGYTQEFARERPVLLRRRRIHRALPRRSRPRRGAGLREGWRFGVGCGRSRPAHDAGRAIGFSQSRRAIPLRWRKKIALNVPTIAGRAPYGWRGGRRGNELGLRKR